MTANESDVPSPGTAGQGAAGADWPGLVARARALRHALHREPELSWQEHDTCRLIRGQLDALSIPWQPCTETGTVARLATHAPGPAVALRADIDALPITETTGLPHASTRAGCMHACGHDGHTATLFAVLWWLKQHEASLPAPVTLIFQPAEEGGHGAREMIAEGALDGVGRIFGWHNWPAIPLGQAVCPDGAVMAANGTFEIEVQGAGGHASQPERCRDPVLGAAAITVALQQVVSRRSAAQDAVVLSVTSIDARSAATVIPDRALLGGSYRLADDRLRPDIERQVTEISTQTAAAHAVAARVTHHPRYGATVNHAGEAAQFRAALAAELGDGWRSEETQVPIMASEDFSYYLREVPGAFALIGAGEGTRHHEPCHSPRYDFNDALIDRAGRVLLRLAGASPPT